MGILTGEIELFDAIDGLDRMPHAKQFISAVEPNVAYVGGQGSGKSCALMTACILNCYAEPNGLSLVGRLNMPALETTTMRTFLELIPEGYGQWAETKKQYTFHNGHQVLFRHLDITDPKIVGHIRSLNLSAAYVDEATETSEEVYFLLVGRLRRKTASRRIIRLASNPAGHDWIWRNFFDPERRQELRLSNRGITASSMDNPFLPPEYIQNMLNTYPEDWAQRFIYGSFADFSDLVYKEFTERTHTWNPAQDHAIFSGAGDPPTSWPVIVGIDIGSDIDPWAIQVTAVAPDGRLYEFAEVYGNSMLISQIAQRLEPHLAGRKVDGIAYDYSNRQCALELAEHQIFGQPALKEVEPGLFKCSQYFHIDPRLQHPFDPQLKGSPRYFISIACKNAIRELGGYKWARNRSGVALSEPSHADSHTNDARRYLIHTFRPLPEKVRAPAAWENPALDMQSKMYWKEQAERKDRLQGFKPRGPMRTIQEWKALSEGKPVRFQRPGRMFRRTFR